MFAQKGLHKFILSLVSRSLSPSAHILELGSGSGAFACRLMDAGFHVTCCDVTAEKFEAFGNARFIKADLNTAFATLVGKEFDAVISLEVIEHLENPWGNLAW